MNTLGRYTAAASEAFGVSRQAIFERGGLRDEYDARHAMTHALMKDTGIGPARAAKMLSRNHATIIHSHHRCEDLLDTDPDFRARYEAMKESLSGDGASVDTTISGGGRDE